MSYLRRGQALFLISALEYVTPFFRMLLLSRFLDLRELGFGSALLASYGLLEQITDMALYRFVMTTKREEYEEALACAHGLSLLRGVLVGALAALTAPLISRAFDLSAYWKDFAVLGAIIFIRSFENFAPRVAERDFHFAAQLKTGLVANVISFIILIAMLIVTHDHRALLASLFALMTCYVVASHIFSNTPYRISFRSALFPRAFKFAFPLMINGVGLALSSQADRFFVGSLLGLPALGVYALILTAVVLPTNMVWRIAGGVNTALFYKALESGKDMVRHITLSGHVSSLIATTYSIVVLFLLNIVVPIVFGAHFIMTQQALIILAFVAYVRIVRGEPFGSLLLLERRTKRLALVNLCVAIGLLFAAVLMYYVPRIESALAARLIGELIGFVSAVYLTRKLLYSSFVKFSVSILIGLLLITSACGVIYFTSAGGSVSTSLGSLSIYGLIILVWAGVVIGPSLPERWKMWRWKAL